MQHITLDRFHKHEELLFGKEGVEYISTARMVIARRENKPFHLKIMEHDIFLDLLEKEKDPIEVGKLYNEIYIKEIIGQFVFVAHSALIRNISWIDGMCASMEHNLYLPFCANLRSLIESVGDSFHTLRYSAVIEGNRSLINDLLENMFSQEIIDLKPSEDALIHYIHGRKIDKRTEKTISESHSALQPWKYVKYLKDKDVMFADLYGYLCQHTHPAKESVQNAVIHKKDKDYYIETLSSKCDYSNIRDLIDRHKDQLLFLVTTGIAPSIHTLKIMNKINIADTYTESVNLINTVVKQP